MHKEMIISIIIIALIVTGNIITQNNTKKAVSEINDSIKIVNEKISMKQQQDKSNEEQETKTDNKKHTENENNNIKEAIEESKKMWEKKHESLAYYLEHDELEKVEDSIIKAKANISTQEYNSAIENLESCVFLLEHIQDKEAFKWQNIF